MKQSEREYSRTTKVVSSKRRKNKCKDNFRQYTTFKMPQFFDLCSSLDSTEEYTLNVCLKSLHKFFLLLPCERNWQLLLYLQLNKAQDPTQTG